MMCKTSKFKWRLIYIILVGFLLGFCHLTRAQNAQISLKEHLQSIPYQEGKKIDLTTALFWISQDWKNSIEKTSYLESIASVVQIVKNKIQNESNHRKIVGELIKAIHNEAKFGYTEKVDNQGLPLNQEELFLHGLLKTKNGYCMTLSLIYLIVGEQLGLPIFGVALPNHFFVRYVSPDYQTNIETTQSGALLSDEFYYKQFGVTKNSPFFMKSLSKKETLGAYFSNVGTVYYKKNQTAKAVFYLELATRINSNSLEAYNNLGNMYAELNQYNKAITQYQTALEIDPFNKSTLFNLGIAFNEFGNSTKTIENYLQVVQIDPFFVPAHQRLTNLFLNVGKYYKALLHLKSLIKLEPNNFRHKLAVAEVYLKTKNPHLALIGLKNLNSILPDNAEITDSLAESYYQLNQFDRAIEQYRYLIEKRPNDFKSHLQLGWTHYRNREIDLAIAWTKRALIKTGIPESLKTLGQINLGFFNLIEKKYEASKSWYAKALVKKKPYVLQNMLKDLIDAEEVYKNFHEIKFFKGWLAWKGGQIKLAIKNLKYYLNKNPKGPNAREAQIILGQLTGKSLLNKNPPQNQTTQIIPIVLEEKMIKIPAGFFLMGSNDKLEDEKPEHKVYLDTFFIDRYEVTARGFSAFLNKNQNPNFFQNNKFSTVIFEKTYRPKRGLERFPINNVSWIGAKAYCRWKGKRLPTEAEWEKAARGTDGRRHPWGSSAPNKKNARFLQQWFELKEHVMVPVDSMPEGKSPYNIHHMAGNVKEWVDDWYDREYYTDPDHDSNPEGPLGGEFKVLKGGSWRDLRGFIYSSFRNNSSRETRMEDYGFRCAKSLIQTKVTPISIMDQPNISKP